MRYLDRALAEPAPPVDVSEMLVELGTAQLGSGDGAGFRTLRDAVGRAGDPAAAARAALAVSRAARRGGTYRPAEATVAAAAAALGDTEPDLLADLQTELAIANRIGTAPGYPTTARVAELARRAAARGDETTSLLLRLAGMAALREPAAAEAGVLAERAAVGLARARHPDAAALVTVLLLLNALDRLPRSLPTVGAVVETARQSGRLLDLLIATAWRAQIHHRLGMLREAEEDARVADRLAAGYRTEHRRHTQAWLLHCLVERGLLDEAEAELAAGGVPVGIAPLLMVRARLRLAQDRPAEALADLDACGATLARRRIRHPNHLPWESWAVVALLRLGRDAEARTRAAAALETARAFGSVRAEGLALWAAGLVERSPELLAEAAGVLDRVPAPLERARALVDLGASLRRANRRADARGPLREGMRLAHERGAAAIVDAATQELAAAGVRLRRAAVAGPDALTPTERRIAERAAAGASNREIAQALFVTAKTVENHLGNAYRKLGVSGRGELAAALATGSRGAVRRAKAFEGTFGS